MPNLHYLVKLAYDLQTSSACEQLDIAALGSVLVFGGIVAHDFPLNVVNVVTVKQKKCRKLHSNLQPHLEVQAGKPVVFFPHAIDP